MSILRLIRALRTTQPIADQACATLTRRLRGKVSPIVLAQADARLRRRIFQGIEPERAIASVIAWATQADHPRWMGDTATREV